MTKSATSIDVFAIMLFGFYIAGIGGIQLWQCLLPWAVMIGLRFLVIFVALVKALSKK